MTQEAGDSLAGYGPSSRRSLLEDAIFTWVRLASGYAAADIIWSDYEQPRPAGAYLALRISNVRSIGQGWLFVEDAEDPAPGAEVVTTVWGKRAGTLTIQAIAGDPTGNASPAEVLETVRTKSFLPSIRGPLNAAGVGIAEFGPVQTVSGVIGMSAFEPRAIMTAELNMMASAEELGTFIETVEITDEITDEVYEIEAP